MWKSPITETYRLQMTVITLKTSDGEKPFYAHADWWFSYLGTGQRRLGTILGNKGRQYHRTLSHLHKQPVRLMHKNFTSRKEHETGLIPVHFPSPVPCHSPYKIMQVLIPIQGLNWQQRRVTAWCSQGPSSRSGGDQDSRINGKVNPR